MEDAGIRSVLPTHKAISGVWILDEKRRTLGREGWNRGTHSDLSYVPIALEVPSKCR